MPRFARQADKNIQAITLNADKGARFQAPHMLPVGMGFGSAFWQSNLRVLKLKYAYSLTEQFYFMRLSYRSKSIIF